MNKAIKIRVYPNEEQKVLIEKTFGSCRWMWNTMLAERKDAYDKTGETIHPTPAKYIQKIYKNLLTILHTCDII